MSGPGTSPTPATPSPVEAVVDELTAPVAIPDAATLATVRGSDQVASIMAARARVEAARAVFEQELHVLEASGRSAVDIKAKVQRSPAKAAAIVGGVGFLALKGPQRLFGLGRRAVKGSSGPMPKAMLPDEIEKTLRKLGSDGDKVRGTLEREFADYAMKAQKDRKAQRRLVLLAILQPLLVRAARSGADWLFSPEKGGFERRMEELRARAGVPPADSVADAVDRVMPPGRPTDLPPKPPELPR